PRQLGSLRLKRLEGELRLSPIPLADQLLASLKSVGCGLFGSLRLLVLGDRGLMRPKAHPAERQRRHQQKCSESSPPKAREELGGQATARARAEKEPSGREAQDVSVRKSRRLTKGPAIQRRSVAGAEIFDRPPVWRSPQGQVPARYRRIADHDSAPRRSA